MDQATNHVEYDMAYGFQKRWMGLSKTDWTLKQDYVFNCQSPPVDGTSRLNARNLIKEAWFWRRHGHSPRGPDGGTSGFEIGQGLPRPLVDSQFKLPVNQCHKRSIHRFSAFCHLICFNFPSPQIESDSPVRQGALAEYWWHIANPLWPGLIPMTHLIVSNWMQWELFAVLMMGHFVPLKCYYCSHITKLHARGVSTYVPNNLLGVYDVFKMYG